MDEDGDGVADIVQAAGELISVGGTDFNRAIDEAVNRLNAMGIEAGCGSIIFLSDGQPNSPVSEGTLEKLEANGVHVCAYGIGTNASMPQLWKLDPQAMRDTALRASSRLVWPWGW